MGHNYTHDAGVRVGDAGVGAAWARGTGGLRRNAWSRCEHGERAFPPPALDRLRDGPRHAAYRVDCSPLFPADAFQVASSQGRQVAAQHQYRRTCS